MKVINTKKLTSLNYFVIFSRYQPCYTQMLRDVLSIVNKGSRGFIIPFRRLLRNQFLL